MRSLSREIVAEIAQLLTEPKKTGTIQVKIEGNADPVGSKAFNQRLTELRAQAVEAEFLKAGVAKSNIDVKGYGFERPVVPRAPGVAEAKDRYVTITLYGDIGSDAAFESYCARITGQ